MDKKEKIAVAIIIIITFILGIITGIMIKEDKIEKANLDAQDCFVKFNNNLQGFKTCLWAKTHDIGFAKMN